MKTKMIERQAQRLVTEWGKLKAMAPGETRKLMDAIEKKEINKMLRNLGNLKKEDS